MADESTRRCWAIAYMRADGTDAERIDYYSSEGRALRIFNRMIDIHGNYPSGKPRFRLIEFREAA